jgi:hypothetical protein
MTILAMLVVLLSQMLNQADNAWTLGESNKESLQNKRVVTDFISNELQSALLPICKSATNGIQLIVNPNTITRSSYNGDTIFWQAPLAADQKLGDIAEIGYFVKWDMTVASNPRSQLCRFFVNPGSSTRGTTVPDPNFLIYSNPTNWLSDSILQVVAPANKANFYQGLFVENVLGFWVQCLDTYGQPITSDASGSSFVDSGFDSRLGYSYKTPTGETITNVPCAIPTAIDIGLVMLDSSAANRVGPTQQAAINAILRDRGSCPSAGAFVSIAAKTSSLQAIKSSMRSYQTRVYLQNSK